VTKRRICRPAWQLQYDDIMIHLAALLLALADNPDDLATERVSTTAAVERLPLALPINRLTLKVDSLALRIELTSTTDTRPLVQRFLASDPQLCPFISRAANTVVLQCRTPRFEARLDGSGARPVLEIREVRGLPLREPIDQIWFFYHPIALKLGSGCPGDTPVARGECHFKVGRFTEAALELRKALSGEQRRVAALRLGDIALRTGDAATAMGWYKMVGRHGSYGRMAVARLCELGGSCLGELRKRVFDSDLLPEPLRTEMTLRRARASAYVGAVKDAMVALQEATKSNPHVCEEDTLILCRRLILFALKYPEQDGGLEALESYMNLRSRTEGYLAIDLVRAAAEKALDLGAPLFAGHLLAASVPWVEGADIEALSQHILRSAEMYLVANDLARARTLFEYADGRLGRKRMSGPRWAALIAAVENVDAHRPAADDIAADRDLAAAYTSVSRSLRYRKGQPQANASESP
jgi:tetratricopeptide (TPR) repeat protein